MVYSSLTFHQNKTEYTLTFYMYGFVFLETRTRHKVGKGRLLKTCMGQGMLIKTRLSVTNLTSENSLPTLVKEVQTNVAIYSHAVLRICVIGGQRLVRIAPPSLLITVVQQPVLHLG